MIELAPNHKIGLPLAKPIMPASGFFGYGRGPGKLLEVSAFGAIVTGPITLRPSRGPAPPRMVETSGGFVLETGWQNPGVRQVIRQYKKLWQRLAVPLIAHLPVADSDDLARTARALESTEAVAAFELGLPEDCSQGALGQWLAAIQNASQLPILTKLPLLAPHQITPLAQAAIKAGSAALVVAAPPRGAGTVRSATGERVEGHYYGYGLQPLILAALARLAELCDVPLIASGGVHTVADARAFLQAGAAAIQLDSLLFVDPLAASALIEAL